MTTDDMRLVVILSLTRLPYVSGCTLGVELDKGALMELVQRDGHGVGQSPQYVSYFPVSVGGVLHSPDRRFAILQSSLSSAMAPATVLASASASISFYQGVSLACSPNKLISSFLYLKFISGPVLVYPELIFEFVTSLQPLSFIMDNPFATTGNKEHVHLLTNFKRQDLRSNILTNYGLDFLQLVIITTVCLLISIANVITKRIQDSSLNKVEIRSGCLERAPAAATNISSSRVITNQDSTNTKSNAQLVIKDSRLNAKSIGTEKESGVNGNRRSILTRCLSFSSRNFGFRFAIYNIYVNSIEFLTYCFLNFFTVNISTFFSLSGFLISTLLLLVVISLIYLISRLLYRMMQIKQSPLPIQSSTAATKLSLESLYKEKYGSFGRDKLRYSLDRLLLVLYDGYKPKIVGCLAVRARGGPVQIDCYSAVSSAVRVVQRSFDLNPAHY